MVQDIGHHSMRPESRKIPGFHGATSWRRWCHGNFEKKHGIQIFCHFEVWADPNHTVVSIYIYNYWIIYILYLIVSPIMVGYGLIFLMPVFLGHIPILWQTPIILSCVYIYITISPINLEHPITGWRFGTWILFFHSVGNNNPNWL